MKKVLTIGTVLGAVFLCVSWTISANSGQGTIRGTWVITGIPQPVPDGPPTPPPFESVFSFNLGGTLTETDGAIHPSSNLELLPGLGPLSGSDGYGSWVNMGGKDFGIAFLKLLFVEGQQIGFLRVQGVLALDGFDGVDGEAVSDFIVGPDLETGEVVFTATTLLEGSRLGN